LWVSIGGGYIDLGHIFKAFEAFITGTVSFGGLHSEIKWI